MTRDENIVIFMDDTALEFFVKPLAFLSRVEFDVMLVGAPEALCFTSDTLGT